MGAASAEDPRFDLGCSLSLVVFVFLASPYEALL
jgi:hypothetical protein